MAQEQGAPKGRQQRRGRRLSAAEVKRRWRAFHALIRECQACQEEVPLHWGFCAHCGTRLASKCPGCGNPLPPLGARYCPFCGLAIPQEGEGASSP